MNEISNPTEAQDLKRRLKEDEFRSLIDVILDGVGRVLQRMTRRSKSPAQWVSSFAIALMIMLIGLLASLLSGGVSRYGYRTLFLGGVLIFAFFIIPRSINQRILMTIRDLLLDALETNAGLASLHGWLCAYTSWKWPSLFGLVYVVVNIVYGAVFLGDLDAPMDLVLVGFPMLIILGIMIYFLFLLLLLPGRLCRCQYRLNAWNPVSTEVVAHLSSLFNYIAYMIAFLLAAIAVFAVSLVTFDITNLILMIPMWLVLGAIFVTCQMSLSRIIKQAKRASLTQVEAQMETLRLRGNLHDKETLETLMRTWDYYDRIKGTRNSVLDPKGVLNFINTLLIPTLAFVVANRNEISEFLGWTK